MREVEFEIALLLKASTIKALRLLNMSGYQKRVRNVA